MKEKPKASSPDMIENPGHDGRAVNARDHLDRSAAALADGHIDFEQPG